LGIALVALGLLSALTSYSPLADSIAADLNVNAVSYGLLGMLAPFTLSIFSLFTPAVARRFSLEWTVMIAAALMGTGQIVRSFAVDSAGFFASSIVIMVGLAAANLLLPSLVKRFFHGRRVSVGSAYLTLRWISSMYPPLLAVPIASFAGWRFAIGIWGLIELLAVIPWIVVIVRNHTPAERIRTFVAVPDAAKRKAVAAAHAIMTKKVWSQPSSWALVVMFAMGTMNFYVNAAWMPDMLQDLAGASPAEAGNLLSLYSGVAIATSFVVPFLVDRVRNLGLLCAVTAVLVAAGYVGLWVAPAAATVLWVILIGMATVLISISLLAPIYRTASEVGGVMLTGMVTFGGYMLGAAGPLVVGVFISSPIGWSGVLAMMMGTSVVSVLASFALRRRVFVDR
jgi:CP family cyanate transporter-like MFS transporter